MKIFSVQEAEETLPLVRRIVTDLTTEFPSWRAAVAEYEVVSGGATAEDAEAEPLAAAHQRVMAHAERINCCLKELEQIGCIFKGFENGLVDFYALKEDRLVFLCWRMGEDHICHWHEVDAGFAGRQQIESSDLFSSSPTSTTESN